MKYLFAYVFLNLLGFMLFLQTHTEFYFRLREQIKSQLMQVKSRWWVRLKLGVEEILNYVGQFYVLDLGNSSFGGILQLNRLLLIPNHVKVSWSYFVFYCADDKRKSMPL